MPRYPRQPQGMLRRRHAVDMLRAEQQERVLRCEQAWVETRRRLHAFVAARLSPEAAVEDVV